MQQFGQEYAIVFERHIEFQSNCVNNFTFIEKHGTNQTFCQDTKFGFCLHTFKYRKEPNRSPAIKMGTNDFDVRRVIKQWRPLVCRHMFSIYLKYRYLLFNHKPTIFRKDMYIKTIFE